MSKSEVVSGYGDVIAVQCVSLDVSPGSITVLLGSNGAGKTTLLKTIAGLVGARNGRIRFGGSDITRQPCHRRVEDGIVLVPEGRMVFPYMSVDDNLRIGAFPPHARRHAAESFEQIYAIFPRLKERRHQYAGTLSGGEQQMLALGRGLMAKPRLLLLDEPTLGLAPAAAQAIFKSVEQLKTTGLTILLAEQDISRALELADWAYVLENGKRVMDGNGTQLLSDQRISSAYLGI